jgi:branched-chain amino acid transport system ATP-binding protein
MLQTLKRRHTIVLIEHDMDAVFSLADRVSVLVYGALLITGDPATVRGDARVREAYLGEEEAARC